MKNENKEHDAQNEISLLMDFVNSVIANNRSPYKQTRKLIEKANAIVTSNPIRALKFVRKAEVIAVSESRIAGKFDNVELLIINSKSEKNRKIEGLISKYKNAINNGRIRSAERIVEKLDGLMRAKNIYSALSILIPETEFDENNIVQMVINNLTEKSIVITSVACSSPEAEVSIKTLAVTIPSRDQAIFQINIGPTYKEYIGLTVNVNYTLNMQENVQRGFFRITPYRWKGQ